MRPEGDDVLIDLPRMIAHLQKVGDVQTDSDLIGRFLRRRDEAAFAALVRRHGPMVLGVCRRVLRHEQDAEDAFQATFLVLAQKASSVLPRESAGPWLYGVAYRVALKAAAAGARRRSRERQVRDVPHPVVTPAEVTDWRPLLDRELSRLSERYRSAVVLCDLEGRPRKEAARLLGVPENTLASRLTRARELLAKRLGGRGVALSGASLAAALAAEATAAQVPVTLSGSTARVAALVAAGNLTGASTAHVVLMKGVMRAMLMQKIRLAVGAFLVVAAVGAVGLTARPGGDALAQEVNQPAARAGGKPATEAEALRREVDDLRATVRILLKEIQALQKRLDDARSRPDASGSQRSATPLFQNYKNDALGRAVNDALGRPGNADPTGGADRPSGKNSNGQAQGLASTLREAMGQSQGSDETAEAQAALNALRGARDPEARRRAAEALERAARRFREQADTGQAPRKQ